MKKEDIIPWDWKRILIGEAPLPFLLEVLLRSLLIYGCLLVFIRLLGKRMSSQMSPVEMGIMLTLGAIIAPVMQLPDRGLLLAVTSLLTIFVFHRLFTLLTFESPSSEKFFLGEERLLVKDGIMLEDQMVASRISREQLAGVLRSKEIFNLGRVKRVYLEACGLFSIYLTEEVHPGLSMLPEEDPEVRRSETARPGLFACEHCGYVTPARRYFEDCPVCRKQAWEPASL